MGKIRWAWLAAIGTALIFAGCSTGREEAKQGVTEFRGRIAQRAFSDVYQTADPGLRAAVTEDKFVELLTALEDKLGAWQSAGDPTWTVMRTTSGHYVKLIYQSQFAKGRAAEEFTWQIRSGQATLVGYYVNSPLLAKE